MSITSAQDAPGTLGEAAASRLPERNHNPARRGPVLLALHGRERSTTPAQLARRLADRLGLELRVVTVVEPLFIYSGGAAEIAPVTNPLEQERKAEQEAEVRRYVAAAFGNHGSWRLDVRSGMPVPEISKVAHEIDATLVVVSAAPHRRFGHTTSGQRAAQVLRRTSCPVVSVAPELTHLPRRALAAVDFSPASIRAVQTALLLMDECATLTLLHVAPPLNLTHPMTDASGARVGGDVAGSFERLRAELRPYLPAGVTIETRVGGGGVTEEVLSTAAEVEADLIAVGTHGPNIVERFFVGSAASNLLHLANCSVVASPAPSAAESVRLKLGMAGTAVSTNARDWGTVLDAFSVRNAGRRVTIEVDDPAFGAQLQARGYALQGVTYDPRDRRVEIMLGITDSGRGHLTRSIPLPESIAISREGVNQDQALEVRHQGGHTLVVFQP